MAESEAELVEQLLIIGNRLASPPTDPQQLLSLLDESERFLSKVEQSPCQSILTALHPAMMALVDEKLLKQSEVDLKVAVASCITEMTRITAPYAPYDDYIMKDFFQMIVNAFEKLNDISSPSYSKRISILETVSKIRSCVIMVDLECDALVLEMFRHFLKTIRPSHPKKVFSLMEDIMTLVLEESEGISSELLSCLLLSVKEDNKDVSPIAHKLAEKVINNCALKLKPYLVEAISTGTYLTDYGSIVASLCQENSKALESEKLKREVTCPGETGSAADKPPRLAIRSMVPTVNVVVEPASPKQNSEQSPHIVQSQSAAIACTAELDDLSCSTAASLEILSDHNTKRTRGRKGNSFIQADIHNRSQGGSDKEVLAVHKRRASGSTEDDGLLYDCQSGKQAEELSCSKPDKKTVSQSSISLDSEIVLVSSLPPTENLPDISKPREWQSSVFTTKEDIIAVADQPASTAVCKETSENSQTGKEPVTSNCIGTKKENEVMCDSKGKSVRCSHRKEIKKNTYNGEEPYKEISSSKKIDGLSVSIAKHLERTSKKGSTISATKRETSSKQRKSKVKKQKGEVIVKKDILEVPSTVIYEAQIHEKELDQKLVGSWIEVWWPDDNRFYPGVIDAYYPHTKKHKILYTDGDTEVLTLKDEYWKLVDSREADREQATDIQSPNASLEKRVEDSGPKTNSELDSKIIRKATTRTVKIAEWMEGNIAINLPQKRPYAEIETETKRSDPTTAEGTNGDLKAKALEVSMRSSLEKESAAKEKKITGKMSPSNSSAALHDLSPSPAPTESGQVRDSRESIINTSVNVSNITRIPARATDICLAEDKHSMEIVAVKKNLVNDEEIEDLKVIEAEKRLQREKRRSLVSSPLIPKASLCDEGHVDLSENIFDSASMEKIRIFSRIIQNKWYQIKLEPLPNYAELADEFGRNAASEHGHLFKTIRQSPHYGGVDASDPKALENLWYTLPLVLEGLHKSLESQRYLQRNIETMRGWFTKLAQAGFDISVPLAAFHLLTVSPTDFKNFRESLKSVSLQLDEEKQNVEDLKSKLPVSKRVAGLDSKIKHLKQQLRDLESERMSLERLEGVELELEKYGTSLKACRLEKLKELYEHKIAEAKQFLRDVSLDGWFECTELASSTQ